MVNSPSRVANPHLRRMYALAYVIPKRKSAAQVYFAEARALLSEPVPAKEKSPQ